MIKIFGEFGRISTGAHFFVANDDDAYADGKPCYGFGMIRYGEGSVYVGDVYFDGERYLKMGFGRQDFAYSEIGANERDLERGVRKAFFIGEFDYLKTNWIYGNGVMYYVDSNNKPACFTKGFFECLNKVGEWQGEFDPSLLAEGYTPDMERELCYIWDDLLKDQMVALGGVKKLENLFVGDSYFELWGNCDYAGCRTFYDIFDNRCNLNIGLGGTKFGDWVSMLRKTDGVYMPERIYVNLGINDFNAGYSADGTIEDFKRFADGLKARFPDSKVYLFNVVHAPKIEHLRDEIDKYNKAIIPLAADRGITVIDVAGSIDNARRTEECFSSDRLHINENGYKCYENAIKSVLAKQR